MIARRLLALVVTLGLAAPAARGDIVVNFNDLSLAGGAYDPFTASKAPAPGSGGYDNGYDLKGGFTSGGVAFGNSYGTYTFGNVQTSYWGGWAYSNVVDPGGTASTAVPDYYHQYAAAAQGGAPGGTGNYAIGFNGNSNGAAGNFINLGAGLNPISMLATNTTYDYLAMANGDQFARKFTAGDFLTLRIFGYSGQNGTGSVVGEVDFSLADFTLGNSRIVTAWTGVNLRPLAGSASLGFGFASSDVGQFGINTPLYFAMDDLTLSPSVVPEPASAILVAAGLGLAGLVARRRPASAG